VHRFKSYIAIKHVDCTAFVELQRNVVSLYGSYITSLLFFYLQ
jgi:hypothetical protein